MPSDEYVLNKIVLDRTLTKVEKLKKMYVFMRKSVPEKNKEDVYEFCKYYYDNIHKGKKKNETYYYG
jgi:hypothetical protein